MSLILFVPAFAWFGFVVPASVLITAWLRYFGQLGWLRAVLGGVLVAIAVHAVFISFLGVPAPRFPVAIT